ncbi:tRNA (adenosine(37)-N6)-threonylcarbamoyltransferase complex ATPase subunit type 1 TsaE [Candidatus Babeliales bacterium]|nr:tRNA (adenosine(37)-N6)-threonylcarbamoyltransferase complex ATPase subunit type 1 TsaE [Candidatus Babeliales bacterium]
MNITEEVTYNVDQIDKVIEINIMPYLQNVRTILFFGSLGAGKTTLIKRLIYALGSKKIVTSPTFNYVNFYQGNAVQIQHFDLYRLNAWEDAEELGLHEQMGAEGSLSLIEWPDIAHLFFQNEKKSYEVLELHISYDLSNHAVRRMLLKRL